MCACGSMNMVPANTEALTSSATRCELPLPAASANRDPQQGHSKVACSLLGSDACEPLASSSDIGRVYFVSRQSRGCRDFVQLIVGFRRVQQESAQAASCSRKDMREDRIFHSSGRDVAFRQKMRLARDKQGSGAWFVGRTAM